MMIKKIGLWGVLVALSAGGGWADQTIVQIRATANTDYGTNTVATMLSDVITAPDGLATYQVSFDVFPAEGRSVRSGVTGTAGASDTQSWGVGPENTLFNGDDNDAVERISNLQITNFNANGSAITREHFFALSFTSLEIANGQSTHDRVQVIAGGVTNAAGGVKMATHTAVIDLEALTGTPEVTEFSLAAGSGAGDPTKNKWSVNYIEVSVCVAWRADWLRGAWGLCWTPEDLYNGRIETLVDDYDGFLDQISGLKTLDFIQLNLGCSYIYSPVHLGPNDLLESFWQGDTDEDGNPINLIVPRASSGVDTFGEWAQATKEAGLKLQVYVNSSQLLQRGDLPNPDVIPNITERWKNWCDTNTEAQAFINSQDYYTDDAYENRPYMFCYAEFVLKDYAIRYGDLIDGWIFDSGTFMNSNGDDPVNGVAADQRIYQAFADAVHVGNPNAAVAFNNSPERDTEELNPFSEAVHFEDYTFGHPYNGGNNMGSHTIGDPPLYDRNYAHIQKMTETGGNVHEGELTHNWMWDDRVVGHFYPCMSTTAWNAGSTPALTDEEFLLWNLEAMQGGGAIAWGAPLRWPNGSGVSLLVQDWGMAQLTLMDAYLSTNEVPGAPRWARAETPLPNASIGQAYNYTLTENVDFWDPEGDDILAVSIVAEDDVPSWLIFQEDSVTPGTWRFMGLPIETVPTAYRFRLRVEDASGATDRWVGLVVNENEIVFPEEEAGSPVWVANPLEISEAVVGEAYTHALIQGVDFNDDDGTELTVVKQSGADWLTLSKTSLGWWQLSGTPSPSDAGVEVLTLRVSDGSRSADCTVVLTVEPAVSSVSIMADANHNYGTDAVATLFSEVVTAYDGLATFRFSVDVTPAVGTAIRSGDGGGSTTSQSWGLFSSGETSNARYLFNGDEAEGVERIGNIQIVDFKDGGGRLTVDDIRDVFFKSITIADAQSGGKDSVYMIVGGATNQLGSLSSNPTIISLNSLSGATNAVDQFALGTGTTNVLNKWAVNGMDVNYSILGPASYSTWAYDHGLLGSDGAPEADSKDQDGYVNLAEFALGMDPELADAGSHISCAMVSENGTPYFEFVHNRRSDYADQGLSYVLLDTTNLVRTALSTNAPDLVLVGLSVDGYESVTNRYSAGAGSRFIKFEIQQQE